MQRILIGGATGRMGRQVVSFISTLPDYILVSGLAKNHTGEDSGTLAGLSPNGVLITNSIKSALDKKPNILIDFTNREAALHHIKAAAAQQVSCIIGTTGFKSEDLAMMEELAKETNVPIFVAPNFSIGAVLMMKFAKEASKYFSWAEIVEMHHEKKIDAPSGTALRTTALMHEARLHFLNNVSSSNTSNTSSGSISLSRGMESNGIHIHSIRLPGLLAHQEVIFGNNGEILTVRHDSTSRECFMAGLKIALEKVRTIKGLVIGLESIID